MSGPVIVSVRNGGVESRTYAQSGSAVTQYADLFPTVDGLFAMIDTAVRSGSSRIEADYDATFGFPTFIAIGNPSVDAPVYTVTDFHAQ